jgi:hypothetical protein
MMEWMLFGMKSIPVERALRYSSTFKMSDDCSGFLWGARVWFNGRLKYAQLLDEIANCSELDALK